MKKGQLTRRDFVRAAGVAFCAAGAAGKWVGGAARFAQPLSAQLYTVRRELPDDPERVLRRIAGIGYTRVEVLIPGFERVKRILSELSLAPVSVHVPTPLVSGRWEAWLERRAELPQGYDFEAALAEASGSGIKYMIVPYVNPAERGGLDVYRELADKMNDAGERCRSAGMRLCYHNHAFEFEDLGGTTPFDVIMERCDPSLVGIELDVFWVSVAGVDPVGLLNEHRGRIALIHLKDKAPGTPHTFTESEVPRDSFGEVGSGLLDFSAILGAAAAAGVDQYIVEQDECPGDPLDSLERSYQYLRALAI